MSAVTIQQMTERVAGLMEERLGVRGKGLSEKLKRGGHLLPRSVRTAAAELADLAEKAQNPKLLAQIDPARVAACYDQCLRYLSARKAGSARMTTLLRVVTTVAFGLLLLAGAVFAVQQMKGGL